MRIQPRQRLLEIWKAVASASLSTDDKDSAGAASHRWTWGGREPSNAITDAEQLLCLILPATEIPYFRLDQPDRTADEVLAALRPFGNARDIPLSLVRIATDYLKRYRSEDGTPVFAGAGLFTSSEGEPTTEQRDLEVTESYATSITVSLAALGFARLFKPELTRPELRAEVDELEELASERLSAAMIGMLRSFAIIVYEVDSPFGASLVEMINQQGLPRGQVIARLRDSLREVAAGLRDLNIGRERIVDLDEAGLLFECGWSWGITESAPPVSFGAPAAQRPGYAYDAPYLYFTVVAMDAIADLFSDRTRLLGLLDDDQQRLSTALRLRWDLTQQYWATIASFGSGRWPLEDIPWRTGDRLESDFFSLLVTSIAARDLAARRDTDIDLSRLGSILTELANRGRLNRRCLRDDPAVHLHDPGVSIPLERSEKFGPPLRWTFSDFASLLLKRSLRVAGLINDIELRGQVLSLGDEVWDHLARRRFHDGKYAGLWDQPANAFDNAPVRTFTEPSWHHTLRVVESLIGAANLTDTRPLRSDELRAFADDLLAEAEHMVDQELLAGSNEAGPAMRQKLESIRQRLFRAREIVTSRPGSSVALLVGILTDLDALAAARLDVGSVL